jgi:signal peptidase I
VKPSPRKPLLALLAHLLFPGLGYFYNGYFKKGIVVGLSFIIALIILFRVSGICVSFPILVSVIISFLVAQILIATDSFKTAKQLQNYQLKKYNKWYFYVVFGVIFWTVIETLPIQISRLEIGIQYFSIPAPSMSPNIEVEDKIGVDFSANLEEIKNGDLVTFKPFSENETLYISRIMAMEGDRFEMRDNYIVLNGNLLALEKINSTNSSENSGEVITEYRETLVNGKKISIYRSNLIDSSVRNIPEFIVPRDSVLFISDNRDKAEDGRYLGFISKNSIKGKLLYTWWSEDWNRIGTDLTKK